MKKLLSIVMALLLVVMCSCTSQKKWENNGDIGTATDTPQEGTAHGNGGDGEGKQQEKEETKSPQQVLEEIGAYEDLTMGIDSTALDFIDAVKNADIDKVAQYTLAAPSLYDFLKEANITSYELIPFSFLQEERKDDVYYGDELHKYLCVVESDGSTLEFPDEITYYFLAVTEFSPFGNSIYYFTPFENTKEIFKSWNGSDNPYIILSESFTDSYGFFLDEGRTNANEFDFNSSEGFHFIPHMMFALEENNYYDAPHSMTDINRFISRVFNGNSGINLKTKDDFNLWVSAEDDDGVYSADDEIYGCYYGHGLSSMCKMTQNIESDKNGVTVTIDGYSDISYFAKAWTFTYKFAVDEEGELPCLYGVEVKKHVSTTPAGYSL